MARIVLALEYDGHLFYGWQRQKDKITVQELLEGALAKIAGHPVSVHCAGRTDAGVHAGFQVAHFDTAVCRPFNAWVRGVNSFLPSGIAVLWAKEVDENFHARYSAYCRRYRYLLLNRPQKPGLFAKRLGWFHLPLDVPSMCEAAGFLLGRHDFSVFRASQCQAKTPVKELFRAEIRKAGELVIFDFEANAFLYHMVRNMVGSLVYVGKGALSLENFKAAMRSKDRRLAAPTFSPDGLYFLGPRYNPDFCLPEYQDLSGGLPVF